MVLNFNFDEIIKDSEFDVKESVVARHCSALIQASQLYTADRISARANREMMELARLGRMNDTMNQSLKVARDVNNDTPMASVCCLCALHCS